MGVAAVVRVGVAGYKKIRDHQYQNNLQDLLSVDYKTVLGSSPGVQGRCLMESTGG